MPDLAVFYYPEAKTRSGKPLDPVARFHLAMAAAWSASATGGYVEGPARGVRADGQLPHDLRAIETNHEAYANQGAVAASSGVQHRLHALDRQASSEFRQ